MSFRLYIMRHGDASMRALTDSLRPLSDRGKNQSVEAGEFLQQQVQSHSDLGLMIVSPYLRAQQTAERVVERLNYTGEIITSNDITPDVSVDGVIAMLEPFQSKKSVLMVSHQPLVSSLIDRLVNGRCYNDNVMATASITCLEMPFVAIGQATLLWSRHSAV